MSDTNPQHPKAETIDSHEVTSATNKNIVTTNPHPHAFRGIIFAALALFLFACMDSTTKYLTTHFNIPFIVAFRYIIHFLLMLILVAPFHSHLMIKTQRTAWVIVRAISLSLASLFIGLALKRLPLAETTAITFVTPLLVVLVAGKVLGEKSGIHAWIAALFGFCGVILIVRPGSGLDYLGVFYALIVVVLNMTYQLLSRILAATEKTLALLFYAALIGTIIFSIALPWFWESKIPGTFEMILLLLLGVFGGLGHYFFTLAYRFASASVLAPVTYLQLVWAGLLGWLLFHHAPDTLSILGMCIIVASGLMIAVKTKRKTNQ